MELSIIIVSWNVCGYLKRCLDSIRAALGGEPGHGRLDYEVIVVDNASADNTPAWLTEAYPWVRLLANPTNGGYGRGCNQGLAWAQGRFLLLLNPDTEILDAGLETLVAYLAAHPDVGLAGPQLRYPDGSIQSSRRRFPVFRTAFLESTILQRLFPHNPLLARYYREDASPLAEQDVDWLVGACLLIRQEAYAAIGGLDERFFMYSEELDYAWRMRKAGWRVTYVPAAQVIHHEGRSSEQVKAHQLIMFHTSKVQLYEKWFGRPGAELLRIFLLSTFVLQWMEEAGKALLGHRRPMRRERMRAYAQVLHSGFRPERLTPPGLKGS